jgi:hypothetical protein
MADQAQGPAAGLAIRDSLAASSRLARWPQLHIACGALPAQRGRHEDAVAACRDALALEPNDPVRPHITRPDRRARRGTRIQQGDLMDVDAAQRSQVRNIEATSASPSTTDSRSSTRRA